MCDPVLARLYRENAVRCRYLATKRPWLPDAPKLRALAAEHERRAADLESTGAHSKVIAPSKIANASAIKSSL